MIRENDSKVLFSGNSAGCFGGAILTGSLTSTESQERFASKVESDNTKVEITENIGDVIFQGTVLRLPNTLSIIYLAVVPFTLKI